MEFIIKCEREILHFMLPLTLVSLDQDYLGLVLHTWAYYFHWSLNFLLLMCWT